MKKLDNYNKCVSQQHPYARTIIENEKKMTLKEAKLKSLEDMNEITNYWRYLIILTTKTITTLAVQKLRARQFLQLYATTFVMATQESKTVEPTTT